MVDINDDDFNEEGSQQDNTNLSRREVRSLIFHLLYAMESFDYQVSLEALVDNFNRGFNLNITPDSEVLKVTQAIINKRDELDKIIKPVIINWRFERIGVCTKLIIRLALWELLNTDIAPNIIINEAIELAKCFSEADAYKFVNGILDELVKNLKKGEANTSKKKDSQIDKLGPDK
jgi:N utilization substance protein B